MNAYPKNIIRVLQKPSVKIPSVLTGVVVSLDTVVMERCAQTLMNAAPVFTTAVIMDIATIPLVPISAVVLKDSMEMACHVKM